MNQNIKEKRIKRKYSKSGIKYSFLARNKDNSYMTEDEAFRALVSVIRDAGIEDDVDSVFFKRSSGEVFVTTKTPILSFDDLNPDFVEKFKKKWTITFYNFTVGIYTVYTDTSEDVTEKVMKAVKDKNYLSVNYWEKSMIIDSCKRMLGETKYGIK